jgi:hypothetical protein
LDAESNGEVEVKEEDEKYGRHKRLKPKCSSSL